MSAASTASPAIVRSSSSRRSQAYTAPASDRPLRPQSTAIKSTAQSYSHTRGPSASQQASLAGVARRDYENTNLARPPSSRRSSSRDGSYAAPPPTTRTESTRSTHRNSSRPGHSRYSSDMSQTPTVVANGASTLGRASSVSRAQNDGAVQASSSGTKRRTTITAATGVWALGKTIGQGSMGKVKLAKNLETGEQVSVPFVLRGRKRLKASILILACEGRRQDCTKAIYRRASKQPRSRACRSFERNQDRKRSSNCDIARSSIYLCDARC